MVVCFNTGMATVSRRRFLAAATSALGACGKRAAAKKNVLFLAVDDLRPELGCYGHPLIQSPNIDRLAGRGLRFDRAYCQQAVCAPSRISLLTGLRPDSTTIYDLQHPMKDVIPDVLSLPRHFKNHGYETVSLGKVYHHRTDDPEAWSVEPWRPTGDWTGRGYLSPEAVRIAAEQEREARAAYERAKAEGKNPRPPRLGMGPAYESADVPDNAYPDGKIADRAIEELRRLAGRPFFLAAGFMKPHLPFNAPKRYWDLYDRDAIRLPPQLDWPEASPEIARMNWGELRGYHGIPRQGPVPEDLARTLIHGYYACVSFTDAQIGRVLDALEELGLADNTTVILWGDHGWKLDDYGAWCKHTNFEIDTRVPLILADPDFASAAGRSSRALVEFVDIYPTLAELCGLDVPPHCEGTSMRPLLEDPDREWKPAAFSQYPRRGAYMGYSMRTERYRYTEWVHRETGEVAARELYDHSTGPIATRNLAADPEMEETVRRLSAMLDKGKGWRRFQKIGT